MAPGHCSIEYDELVTQENPQKSIENQYTRLITTITLKNHDKVNTIQNVHIRGEGTSCMWHLPVLLPLLRVAQDVVTTVNFVQLLVLLPLRDLQPLELPRDPTWNFSSSPPQLNRLFLMALTLPLLLKTPDRLVSSQTLRTAVYTAGFHVSSPPAHNCQSLVLPTGEPLVFYLSSSHDSAP